MHRVVPALVAVLAAATARAEVAAPEPSPPRPAVAAQAPGAVAAQGPAGQGVAARHPLDVRIVPSAAVKRAWYLYGELMSAGPPDPGGAIPVGQQAVAAYQAVEERAFARGAYEAELSVEEVRADVELRRDLGTVWLAQTASSNVNVASSFTALLVLGLEAAPWRSAPPSTERPVR